MEKCEKVLHITTPTYRRGENQTTNGEVTPPKNRRGKTMAFTRKALAAMGIESEKIEQIIEMHTEVTEGLKTERDDARADAKKYKADAEKLTEVTKELETLKADKGGNEYKEKYDKLKTEYDNFKNEQTAKETKAAKEKAYKKLLRDNGVSEKRIDAVVRISDLDNVELDENGAIKDTDKVNKYIKDEFSDYITKDGAKGADTTTPPKNDGAKMSKDDIMKIENDTERQRAIAENHELFGF
jgi:arginyl-tRNA synthetase